MPNYSTFKTICGGMLLGGLSLWYLAQHHVLYTDDGLVVVERQTVPFSNCLVDTRGWQATEWAEHPELVSALVNDNRGSLVVRAAAEELVQDSLQSASARAVPASPAVTPDHVRGLEQGFRHSIGARLSRQQAAPQPNSSRVAEQNWGR